MNDTQRHNPNDTTIEWDRLDDATLLRALADGELPADAESALRAKLGDETVNRAADFENRLRERCGACMASGQLPEGLREHVAESLAGDAGDVISLPERGFWAGGGRALLGIAAVAALAATVWVLAPTSPPPAERFLQQATQHISGEHGGCELNPSYFETKLAQIQEDESPEEYIAEQIGDLPVHLELGNAGYSLSGVGGCHLPGPGKSVHLLYKPTDPQAMFGPVSLFIQDATANDQGLEEGVVYTNGTLSTPYLRIWREGRVMYYMATSCPVGCNMIESAYALTGEKIPL